MYSKEVSYRIAKESLYNIGLLSDKDIPVVDYWLPVCLEIV